PLYRATRCFPSFPTRRSSDLKVWVVDANRNVYVYDTNGLLLGSWSAGGFNASAQLEGVTTNGADVWIVDAKSAKVYRFANAAGLDRKSTLLNSSHEWISYAVF